MVWLGLARAPHMHLFGLAQLTAVIALCYRPPFFLDLKQGALGVLARRRPMSFDARLATDSQHTSMGETFGSPGIFLVVDEYHAVVAAENRTLPMSGAVLFISGPSPDIQTETDPALMSASSPHLPRQPCTPAASMTQAVS